MLAFFIFRDTSFGIKVDTFFSGFGGATTEQENVEVKQINNARPEVLNDDKDREEADSNPRPAAPVVNKLISYDVPFTSQAPLGNWEDDRQQNACEEVSALMAIKWARGETIKSPEEAEEEILAIAEFEAEKYGEHRDVSSRDTVDRIYKDYFDYNNVKLMENAYKDDIKNALAQGKIVVAAADGQLLDNPHYTPPGPDRHMLVIVGYDPITKEFVTNDPGTKHGKNYRYDEDILYSALRDYPTGYHEPILEIHKPIIVIEKQLLKY